MSALGLYFLGATIVSHQALTRVKAYTEKITGPVDDVYEKHLTVLPPFLASFEDASAINLGCAGASILSTHPINTTIFAMKGLDVMGFGGMSFLHFPIQTFTTGEPWNDYVWRVRKKLREHKVDFRHPIPDEYKPHITIHEGKNLGSDRSMTSLIRESKREPVIHFQAYYLTLYAKYKHGWDTLGDDPTKG
jgi:hypothetical protein